MKKVIDILIETNNIDDLLKLSVPTQGNEGRMGIMAEVMGRMKTEFDCINIGYVIGPYTLAGLLMGATNVVKSVLKNPGFLQKILEFTSRVIDYYASSLIKAGADMLCILEPTATLLSPKQFQEFSGEYIKDLKSKWGFPTVLHICGDTTVLIPEMINTGCNGLSQDSMVDLEKVKRITPEEIMIVGNIDPVRVLAYGERDEVNTAVKDILKVMEGRENFILSSGCDLPPDTKLENIEEMFHAAE